MGLSESPGREELDLSTFQPANYVGLLKSTRRVASYGSQLIYVRAVTLTWRVHLDKKIIGTIKIVVILVFHVPHHESDSSMLY